ncbi:hypothetical protein LCGC14_1678170 [marine sediment metagenome]|uniref:Uncharacterized protein n=1 Tax=marine sediment metagenome TaxID=412755 RepID=A0A0F9K537_9ZZZZ
MKVVRTERGWGGHFIAASMCRFRRNTLLECGKKRIVVSTVGCYYPPGADNSLPENPENASTIGYERYYETMAFEARFSEPYWEANVCKEISFESEWSLNECEQETDLKADQMHEAVVAELSKGLKGAIMTEIREGTIELQTKINGKIYALGIDLNTIPTEEKLVHELKWLTRALVGTLKKLKWFNGK